MGSLSPPTFTKVERNGRFGFFQFDGPDQCIPFVVWVNDPLNAIGGKFRIVIGEGYFCRRVGRFADTN